MAHNETEMPAVETPWVVAIVDGGIVQWEYTLPGTGTPDFDVLDFDREGADNEEINDLVETATDIVSRLSARGVEAADIAPLRYEIERVRRFLS